MNDYQARRMRRARRIIRAAERQFAEDGNRDALNAAMEKAAALAKEARKNGRV